MADVDTFMEAPEQGQGQSPDQDQEDIGSPSPSVSSASDQAESAGKTLTVPHDSIVGIEHPCIIRDIDRAIKVLGGEHRIKSALKQDGNTALPTTSLRPDDPFAKKIISQKADVNHVLLRIVLPRRTGRKRKRGTDEPYEFYDSDGNIQHDSNSGEDETVTHSGLVPQNGNSSKDGTLPPRADEVITRLASAKDDYQIQPLGAVKETHQFRSLPDFQLLSQDSPLMQHISRSLLPGTISGIKSFSPDLSVRANLTHIPGPPRFAPYTQPLHYAYAQNRATTTTVDVVTGTTKSTNYTMPRRRILAALSFDAPAPSGPPPQLPNISTCPKALQQAVRNLTSLIDTRPLVTRRAALNMSPDVAETLFKDCTQYVTYAFKSGPWKDTHVKFGTDPRQDPECRKWQTLGFQLDKQRRKDKGAGEAYKRPHLKEKPPEVENDHIFDGKKLGENKTFQVADIVEETLKQHFDEAEVLGECDIEQTGWYGNGTIYAARTVMRDMMRVIKAGEDTARWKKVYERALKAVPGIVTEENADKIYVVAAELSREGLDAEEVKKTVGLVTEARSMSRSGTKGVGKHRRARGKSGRYEIGPRTESVGEEQNESMLGDEDNDSGLEDGADASGSEGVGALADLEAAEFVDV
ncbi:Transcription factor tau subunit sfc1 [Elsinoe australis]|uniref:Transcription factor tau subunit sfc1 n=1 Tax=Elsinoe australis TaxID=40998 RepID=A0A2P7YKR6_9PEZI|nr:Transcription factor tau subunit sfc1 [Elsinoe australis]